jgi:hypothetical protein
VNPVYAYSHNGSSSSITAALVYTARSSVAAPEQAAVCGLLQEVDQGAAPPAIRPAAARDVMTDVGGTTRLAQGPDGNLHQLTLDGKLWRIAPVPTGV